MAKVYSIQTDKEKLWSLRALWRDSSSAQFNVEAGAGAVDLIPPTRDESYADYYTLVAGPLSNGLGGVNWPDDGQMNDVAERALGYAKKQVPRAGAIPEYTSGIGQVHTDAFRDLDYLHKTRQEDIKNQAVLDPKGFLQRATNDKIRIRQEVARYYTQTKLKYMREYGYSEDAAMSKAKEASSKLYDSEMAAHRIEFPSELIGHIHASKILA